MINLLCDEFSLTLDLNYSLFQSDSDYFYEYIEMIDNTLSLSVVLGNKKQEKGGLNGYETVLSWGYDNKRIKFMYSASNPQMKMQLRLSASALKNYMYQYHLNFSEDMTVLKILKILEKMNDDHKAVSDIRLSRIDIAFDFIDEDIDVPALYENIRENRIAVFNKRNSRVDINEFKGEQYINTLYFNKRSSASMLRIYNKKLEQMSKNDVEKYAIAYSCETWTRFELELKKDYAHSLTSHILRCNSEQEYLNVIAQAFIDCFKIRKLTGYDKYQNEVYEDTYFYEQMISFSKSTDKLLESKSYQQLTDFEKKYKNLFKNGTMPFFKMIQEAYGDAGLDDFLNHLKNDLDNVRLDDKQKTIVKQNKNAVPFF